MNYPTRRASRSCLRILSTKQCLFALVIFSLLLVYGGTGLLAEVAKPAGLPNFHEVTKNIYRGGAPTEEGLKSLKAMKICTIIDLRISPKQVSKDKKLAESMGFKWLNLPMGKEAPTKKQVETLLSTLAKAAEEPVFVHCQHGADRTGCMIGIYRVQVQDWSFSQAWVEMRKYGFKPYLSELKEAVRSRAKTQ